MSPGISQGPSLEAVCNTGVVIRKLEMRLSRVPHDFPLIPPVQI